MELAGVAIVVSAIIGTILFLTWGVVWLSFKISDWISPPPHPPHPYRCVCPDCKEAKFKKAIEEREYLRHQEEIRRAMQEMDREKL